MHSICPPDKVISRPSHSHYPAEAPPSSALASISFWPFLHIYSGYKWLDQSFSLWPRSVAEAAICSQNPCSPLLGYTSAPHVPAYLAIRCARVLAQLNLNGRKGRPMVVSSRNRALCSSKLLFPSGWLRWCSPDYLGSYMLAGGPSAAWVSNCIEQGPCASPHLPIRNTHLEHHEYDTEINSSCAWAIVCIGVYLLQQQYSFYQLLS